MTKDPWDVILSHVNTEKNEMKNEVIEVYKPDYTKLAKVKPWVKLVKLAVLAVAFMVATNANAGWMGVPHRQERRENRHRYTRAYRVPEKPDTTWEDARAEESADNARREAAIRERERRERIARWESIDWSRRDYDIAERVIGAWNKLRHIGTVAFNVDYTDSEYEWAKDPETREKANVIIRVYRAKHPEEFAVKAATIAD